MRTAILSGRLGRDPEVRAAGNGEYSVLNFSIANNDESKKGIAGEYENITSWFDITFWTKKPQHWIQQLVKGVEVIVECDVKQDTWNDSKTGDKKSKIKFIVKRGMFPLIIPAKEKTTTEDNSSYTPPKDDSMPF